MHKPPFDGRGMAARNLAPERVIGTDGKSYPATVNAVDHEAIRRLRAQGFSMRGIAARVGCSVGTVARVLKCSR